MLELNVIMPNTIIDVIANPSEMQAPDSRRAHTGNRRTNQRITAEERKALREIIVERLWRQIAILIPPRSRAVNMVLCALGDAYVHGYLAVSSGKLRQYFFGRDHLPLIGLGN